LFGDADFVFKKPEETKVRVTKIRFEIFRKAERPKQ
jgi:hypothetical protein